MTLTKVIPILGFVASSYSKNAIIGVLIGGLLFCVACAIDPELSYDKYAGLLSILVLGPIGGCLVTFASRRLIDLIVRISPRAISGPGDSGDGRTMATVATISAMFLVWAFTSMTGQGSVERDSIPKCTLSAEC